MTMQEAFLIWIGAAVLPAYAWSRNAHPSVTFGGLLVMLTLIEAAAVGLFFGVLIALPHIR